MPLAFTLWRSLANFATADVAQASLQTVILPALVGTRAAGGAESEDLAAAGQALAERVTADQAEALLQQQAIFGTLNAGQGRLESLLPIAVTLTSRLRTDDAQREVGRVLKMIGWTIDSKESADHAVPIARELLDKMPADVGRRALVSAVGWASTEDEANLWTTLFIQRYLSSKNGGEADMRAIVELLKFPTMTGAPTQTLLDALRARDASAPGSSAGLLRSLEWVAQKYPAIDVASAPGCPAPATSGLTCPAAVR